MTENFIHPINPETVGFAGPDVIANGRTLNETSVFMHLRNVSNLEIAMQEPVLNNEGKRLVTGPAIDQKESRRKKKAIFDHHAVGIWLEIITINNRGSRV